jgi:L-fuconolactonase
VPPTLSVVIDHLGNPPLAAGIDSSAGRAWAEELRAIAELPNACVKLSGLAPEVCETRTYDQNADAFLEHALQVFGAERAMLGSDWPVSSGRAGSRGFSDWAMRVLRIVGDDADSRAAVKARTGERFYELSVASQ